MNYATVLFAAKQSLETKELFMKLSLLNVFLVTISTSTWAIDGITPNHQVNPPHSFKRLVCFEKENRGANGYTIVIDVPNGQDAEAKVYFNRLSAPRSLIAAWQVKYILNPDLYATFTNQFQKMDISRGFDDRFHLIIQLHSGNGKNGVYDAVFQNAALVGYAVRNSYETRLNQKSMNCKFQ